MSACYEDAPSTAMVDVGCPCCGRALIDADSVETGMGPVCRKRHGVIKPDRPAEWPAHPPLLLSDAAKDAWARRDAHKVVNCLVFYISTDRAHPRVCEYIDCIDALGYTRVGTALRRGNAGVLRRREQDRAEQAARGAAHEAAARRQMREEERARLREDERAAADDRLREEWDRMMAMAGHQRPAGVQPSLFGAKVKP